MDIAVQFSFFIIRVNWKNNTDLEGSNSIITFICLYKILILELGKCTLYSTWVQYITHPDFFMFFLPHHFVSFSNFAIDVGPLFNQPLCSPTK